MPETPDTLDPTTLDATTWPCHICLHPSAQLKQDRRGGRYLTCAGCGSRTFVKGTSTFGLDVLRAVVATLDASRLRGLREQLGSTVVVGALAQTLKAAAKNFRRAVQDQINLRDWEDLSMQMDNFLGSEQNGDPDR